MIVGIGTDIVDVERIAGVFDRQGEAFAQRILSLKEQHEFAQSHQPTYFLAKRWALKEAVGKALGTGISQGVSFTDMTISHHESGQPYLVLRNKTLKYSESLGITDWLISVSDEKNHAVAFVIAEKRI